MRGLKYGCSTRGNAWGPFHCTGGASDERSLVERKEVRNTGEKRSSVRMGSV